MLFFLTPEVQKAERDPQANYDFSPQKAEDLIDLRLVSDQQILLTSLVEALALGSARNHLNSNQQLSSHRP